MEFERVIFRSKPGFNQHEDNGVSAFEEISESSFPGKCKVIYFYPKDFTFVCPTEIAGFNKLTQDFTDRDTILMGGSVDNEYVKLAWRDWKTVVKGKRVSVRVDLGGRRLIKKK